MELEGRKREKELVGNDEWCCEDYIPAMPNWNVEYAIEPQ